MASSSLIQRAMSEGTKLSEDTLAGLRATPIMNIVENLHTSLTSTDAKTVNLAIHLLGRASQARSEPLNKASVVTLLQFLGMKCRNYGTQDAAVEAVGAVIVGLTADGSGHNHLLLDADVLTALIKDVLAHLHVQSLVLTTRRICFGIFSSIIDHDAVMGAVLRMVEPQAEGAPPLGAMFMKVFLGAIEGERDPVLLHRVFSLSARVLTEVPDVLLAFLRDDYFECYASYFPVLFNAPPGCTVTRDDLRVALHRLLSLEKFSDLALPFLCSKLTSPSSTAKVDSLHVIREIFSSRTDTVGQLAPLVGETMMHLRAEALKINTMRERSPDALQMLRLCMDVITAVAGAACDSAPEKDDSLLLSLLDAVVSGAITTMESDSGAGRTYATLLHACGRSRPRAALVLSRYLIPLISGLSTSPPSAAFRLRRQENCFSCLGGLLSALEERLSRDDESDNEELEQTSLRTKLCDEAAFVRAELLHDVFQMLFAAVEVENDDFVLRVAGECLVTWCAIAKRLACESSWLPPLVARSNNVTVYVAVYRRILQRVFGSDVSEDTAKALAATIRNVSVIDSENVRQTVAMDLPKYSRDERFTKVLEWLTGDEAKVFHLSSSLLIEIVDVVLVHCVAPFAAELTAQQGSGCVTEPAALRSLFGRLSLILTACPGEALARKARTWISASLNGGSFAAAFDFAAILFSGLSEQDQRDAATQAASSCACSSSTPQDSVVLCGVDATIFQACVCEEALMKVLCGAAAYCLGEDFEPVQCAIPLRLVGAAVNKAVASHLSKQLSDALGAQLESARSPRGSLSVVAALVKGCYARGASEFCAPFLSMLVRECQGCGSLTGDPSALQESLPLLLGSPKPKVCVAFWEQRLFQTAVEGIMASSGCAVKISFQLASIASLVEVANPAHVRAASSSLLRFVKDCSTRSFNIEADSGSARSHFTILFSRLVASETVRGASLGPVLSLLVTDSLVFDGLVSVIREPHNNTALAVSSTCAAIHTMKALALALEGASSADNNGKSLDAETAVGFVSADLETQDITAKRAFEIFRKSLMKSLFRALQDAAAHPKRQVRRDAAECRHIWDRALKQ